MELNEGAVHAIDAPEEATVQGPFHVVLHNAGGPVHVHLHLDDDLSTVARIDEANHYVEGGETSRIPIGIVPDRAPAGGALEIVTGYGAERTTVEVTVAEPDAADAGVAGSADGTTQQSAAEEGQAQRGTVTAAPSGGSRVGNRGGRTRRTSRKRRSRRGSALFDDPVPDLLARVGADSPEALAFLALAVVAVLVGLAVIVAVGEVLLSLVVVATVTGAVAVAGWLLLE